jgi:hypothetical protein
VVDEGINGNDDDHIQKDKDDIDDEIEAMTFTITKGLDDDEKKRQAVATAILI